MRALRQILKDLAAQGGLRGAAAARCGYVLAYYWFYGRGRRLGESRDGSRLRALGELARRGWSSKTARVRLPNGLRLELDLGTAAFLVPQLLRDREYGRLPRFLPQPGQLVVDVGAHQGVFALDAALRVGPRGRVVAVEPHAGNRRLLEENARRNGLSQVSVVGLAAADFTGPAELHLSGLVSGGHSLVFRSIPGEKRVAALVLADTLDNILARLDAGRPDLIKIDVEGACLQVLQGAGRALSGRPRLVMEVEGGEDELQKVRARVESLGYGACSLDSILYAEAAGA